MELIFVRETCEYARPTANSGFILLENNERIASQLRSTKKSSVESAIPDLVIYNRVPKCGSTTMLQVLKHVRKENNFRVFNQIGPDLSVRHH